MNSQNGSKHGGTGGGRGLDSFFSGELGDYVASASVEEAGALVGASITKLTIKNLPKAPEAHNTPLHYTGRPMQQQSLHAARTTPSSNNNSVDTPPTANAELYFRLDDLRRWLERWDKAHSKTTPESTKKDHPQQPLYHAAAPSLVAVLNKLFSLNTCTPMMSTAIRTVWAKSMVHCYRLGLGYSPQKHKTGLDVGNCIKQLLSVISSSSRSLKAQGGTRYAALQLLSLMLQDAYLSSQILGGGYTTDLVHTLYKCLKSSHSDALYRSGCVKATSSVISAARSHRQAQLEILEAQYATYNQGDIPKKQSAFVVLGAVEEKTILDVMKLLRRASEDNFPEVRHEGGLLACNLAPVVTLLPKPKSNAPQHDDAPQKLEVSPMVHLDELLTLCLKHISDDHAYVAKEYCVAVARCTCSAMDAVQLFGMSLPTGRGGLVLPAGVSVSAGGPDNDVGDVAAETTSGTPAKAKIMQHWKSLTESRQRSHAPSLSHCGTFQSTLEYFVAQFRKESNAGQVGYAQCLLELLRLYHSVLRGSGWSGINSSNTFGIPDILKSLFDMVGTSRASSTAEDSALARLSLNRVLRRGLGELSSELAQQTLIKALSEICFSADETAADSPNDQQLQVALIEISHLLTSLGEAAPSMLDHVQPALEKCICHAEAGVRMEAAAVYAALGACVPGFLQAHIQKSVTQCQYHKSELVHLVAEAEETADQAKPIEEEGPKDKRRGFRKGQSLRKPGASKATTTPAAPLELSRQQCASSVSFLRHQYSLHGNALVISMLLHEIQPLLRLSEVSAKNAHGNDDPCIPLSLLQSVIDLAEELVWCQFNEPLARVNAGASCTCVRAGYYILAAAHTIGPCTVANATGSKNSEIMDLRFSKHTEKKEQTPSEVKPTVVTTDEEIDDDEDFGDFEEGPTNEPADDVAFGDFELVTSTVNDEIEETKQQKDSENSADEQQKNLLQRSFLMWEATGESIERGTKYFSPPHDVICLEAMMASILSFLRYCSPLLLSVPRALNTIVRMLEGLLPLVAPEGRLGLKPKNAAALARLQSVRASFMETFSWLPPGSYPLVADVLFQLSAGHIQQAIQTNTCCSILESLIPREDELLDAQSYCRSTQFSHSEGSRDLEEMLLALTVEPVGANEREAVMHCLPWRTASMSTNNEIRDVFILNSDILGFVDSDDTRFLPPSVLHKVSNWRKPAASSTSGRIRLVDAAIQAFAATFGLQSGREQENAISLLRSCLPVSLIEANTSQGSFSVKDALMSEQERKLKMTQENIAASNVTAAIVLCILNLPRSVGSHEMHADQGLSWTKAVADSFILLMSSSSSLVRRASAEGLALLATCGFNENALTLQTSILAQLEETMQGANPVDGKPRKAVMETYILSKSAALLTIGCLRRASVRKAYLDLEAPVSTRSPTSPRKSSRASLPLPTAHMVRRLLNSLSENGNMCDTIVTRIYALHALNLLIVYYDASSDAEQERVHLLRTAAHILQESFISLWGAVHADADRGQEAVKFSAEPALLAVMIRLMHSLLPHVELTSQETSLTSQFVVMTISLVEFSENHPSVVLEALAFFDCLANGGEIFSPINGPDTATSLFLPLLMSAIDFESLSPQQSRSSSGFLFPDSIRLRWAALKCLNFVLQASSTNQTGVETFDLLRLRCNLIVCLEVTCGSKMFLHSSEYKGVSAPRNAESPLVSFSKIADAITTAIENLLAVVVVQGNQEMLLNWMLFSRMLMSGTANKYLGAVVDENNLDVAAVVAKANRDAALYAMQVLSYSSPTRWQVKVVSARACQVALSGMIHGEIDLALPQCNPIKARECILMEVQNRVSSGNYGSFPKSYASLHLEDLLASACNASAATSDQAELPQLQNEGICLMAHLLLMFGRATDPNASNAGDKTRIVDQFTSQIVSSIRHALSDSLTIGPTQALFLTGCEVAVLIIKEKLIEDPAVLKRLLRPAFPTQLALDYSICDFAPEKEALDLRPSLTKDETFNSALFDRASKIGLYAKLMNYANLGSAEKLLIDKVLSESKHLETNLAIYAAALSVDAARITFGSAIARKQAGINSSTRSFNFDEGLIQIVAQTEFEKGICFPNVDDLSHSTKQALDRYWPSLCAYSLSRFVALALRDDSEGKTLLAYWAPKLVPLTVTGLKAAILSLPLEPKGATLWTGERSVTETVTFLLQNLRLILRNASIFEGPFMHSIDQLVFYLLEHVLITTFEESEEHGTSLTDVLVIQTCGLVDDLCESALSEVTSGIVRPETVAKVILRCIAAYQESAYSRCIENMMPQQILTMECCLKHSDVLLQIIEIPDSPLELNNNAVASSLLHVGFEVVGMLERKVDARAGAVSLEKLRSPAMTMITSALRRCDLSNEKKLSACSHLAKSQNWAAWSILCRDLADGTGLNCSIDYIKFALLNERHIHGQQKALVIIKSLVQECGNNPLFLNIIMHGLGAHIMLVMKRYSLGLVAQSDSSVRLTVCTESIRILLIVFNHLLTAATPVAEEKDDSITSVNEDQQAQFLAVLFTEMVCMIKYNGLPNNIQHQNQNADSGIGRICAACVVQVAKASAAIFKQSMALLSMEERSTLEAAMRAELTGYPLNSSFGGDASGPKKKGKINFKAFK